MAVDNPGRPPRDWMRRCVRGVERGGSARDPGAVCGSVWYHKLSAAERRKIMRREEPLAENPDPAGTLLAIAIGAVAVLGAAWALRGGSGPSADCQSFETLDQFAKGMKIPFIYVHNLDRPAPEPPTPEYPKNAAAYFAPTCTFYRWDGKAWVRDVQRHTELQQWLATRERITTGRLKGHPSMSFLPSQRTLPMRRS